MSQSQSRSGGLGSAQKQGNNLAQNQTQNENKASSESKKSDLFNGFENRSADHDKVGDPKQSGGMYPTTRRQSTVGLPEDRHPIGQLAPQQYHSGTQPVAIQVQPHFIPDYSLDNSQYAQIRSQFEVRSQAYPGQFADRSGYVSRDAAYRENNMYGQTGYAGQGQYVTVPHPTPIPSQSTSPQPPFFAGVVVPPGQAYPQFAYSQYPQTVINPVSYNAQATLYAPQPFSQQSPNTQRFQQDLTQYQTQPIIQPIAQNIGHIPISGSERPSRGPKPLVPPRINSKITHDPGVCKSVVVEAQKPGGPTDQLPTLVIASNPRTRQDGLYIDTGSDSKDKTDTASESGSYVSRPENRKSISADVTSSFQRRNDTVTFSFPDDGGQDVSSNCLKPPTVVDMGQVYSGEQGIVESGLRVSPMGFEMRREGKGKPEWSNVSPNQRATQENRRSDYFEEHRRSPMNLEGKRFEEVRRSPMPFVPIRDTSADRASQKSPSFANPNFEKTRQELALWAEQRQRQELERSSMPGQLYSTSPRLRAQSEERKSDKDVRLSQSAFQPMPNISQNTIMEQRRHLRHVSADLTKHMEFSKKEFDDQSMTGSVINLGPAISISTSQRASPNICNQYAALSEAKLDSKTVLTIDMDFDDKPLEQVDHIIHSHRKSQNFEVNHDKGLASYDDTQSEQSSHTPIQKHIQMQNQQCLDILSEKLTECERQQSDLQAKLACLQSQNHILDKVAVYQQQHPTVDLQKRLKCLQTEESSDHYPSNFNHHEQEQTPAMPQCQHYQSLLTTVMPQNHHEKLSPRLQQDLNDGIPSLSQYPLTSIPQMDRNYPHYYRIQCAPEELDSATTSSANAAFSGALKRIPPEKPPRTSLIVQSPEAEVKT